MRQKRSTRFSGHGKSQGLPLCLWCERPTPPHFAFEFTPGRWVHPDCQVLVTELPSDAHWLPGMFKGKTVVHTCGDSMCVNPAHLQLVEG